MRRKDAFRPSPALLIELEQRDYTYEKYLGSGSYADVILIYSNTYKQTFALKIELEGSSGGGEKRDIEIESLKRLSHPNVINVYDHFYVNNSSCLVLEYCPGGSLQDYIGKNGAIQPPLLYDICRQLLSAVEYMHQKGIAHRDIKPANILLDSYNRPKLADFGISEQKVSGESTKSFNGSKGFMAPELWSRSVHDPFLADIWSLGVTFLTLASGTLPWPTFDRVRIKKFILMGSYIEPTDVDPEFSKAIAKMMRVVPFERVSLSKLLSLPIFQVKTQKKQVAQSNSFFIGSRKRAGFDNGPILPSLSRQYASPITLQPISSHYKALSTSSINIVCPKIKIRA